MKYYLLLLLAIPLSSKAQVDTSTEDGNFKMSKVITIEGEAKDQIFTKAKDWIYKTYKSGPSVMQTEDKEGGKLFCKGNTGQLVFSSAFIKMNGGRFKYDLTIFCKDGKAKIMLDGITHLAGEMTWMKDGSNYTDEYPTQWSTSGKGANQKQWVKMKSQGYLEFAGIIEAFTKSMAKKNNDANF